MSTPYTYRLRLGRGTEYEIGFAHLHELVDYLNHAGPFAAPRAESARPEPRAHEEPRRDAPAA